MQKCVSINFTLILINFILILIISEGRGGKDFLEGGGGETTTGSSADYVVYIVAAIAGLLVIVIVGMAIFFYRRVNRAKRNTMNVLFQNRNDELGTTTPNGVAGSSTCL
jgi:hypothetical protein